eukprot:1185326-Prorocentrum_minimum.AAC.1
MGSTAQYKSEVLVTTFDGKKGKIVAFSKRAPEIVSPEDDTISGARLENATILPFLPSMEGSD